MQTAARGIGLKSKYEEEELKNMDLKERLKAEYRASQPKVGRPPKFPSKMPNDPSRNTYAEQMANEFFKEGYVSIHAPKPVGKPLKQCPNLQPKDIDYICDRFTLQRQAHQSL